MAECITSAVPETENADNTKPNFTEIDIHNDVPEPKGRKQPEFRTEYCDIACRLKAAYFNDQDVAYALGVSLSTIQGWKRKYDNFKRAVEDGRREQKKRLVARAMKMAMGYSFTEKNEKLTYDKDDNVIKRETSQFDKECPGNERLLVFLLCNLDRQLDDNEWKAANKVELDDTASVTINIDGKAAKEQIKKLSGDLLHE